MRERRKEIDSAGENRPGKRADKEGPGLKLWRARGDLNLIRCEYLVARYKATFDEPTQLPESIETVIVNGQMVVDSGEPAEARPGKVLL